MAMAAVEESNDQFLGAWSAFARGAEYGEVAELGGVVAMYSNVPVSYLNVIGFDSAVQEAADLDRRIRAATSYARRAGFPYFAAVCLDMLAPDLRPTLDEAFGHAGLSPFMEWTGMAAEPVAAARKAAPAELEILAVTGSASRIAVNDINCAAYGMDAEAGRAPLSRDELWDQMYGSVGYVNGDAAATATTRVVDGRLYVAFVATHPDYQRRGYAEACMRDSLRRAARASGIERSILHATDAGHPVYRKMGYHDVTKFILYAESEQEHA